jgi:hypothetical protein
VKTKREFKKNQQWSRDGCYELAEKQASSIYRKLDLLWERSLKKNQKLFISIYSNEQTQFVWKFSQENFNQLTHNVPMLELVAAWEPSFLHFGETNLGKRNEQFTENLAMSFSMCWRLL